MEQLSADWEKAFEELQEHVDSSPFRVSTVQLCVLSRRGTKRRVSLALG